MLARETRIDCAAFHEDEIGPRSQRCMLRTYSTSPPLEKSEMAVWTRNEIHETT